MDAFLDKLAGCKIEKKRALKQIRFSNSPVEAIHRTMKGRYLKNQKFESIRSLNKFIKWAVNDYNVLRPHYKHRPKTPHEVYFNIELSFDVKMRAKQAVKKRVKKNKCAKCIQCRTPHKAECGK